MTSFGSYSTAKPGPPVRYHSSRPPYARSALLHAAIHRFPPPRHHRVHCPVSGFRRYDGGRAPHPAATPVVVPGALPHRDLADRRPLLALPLLPSQCPVVQHSHLSGGLRHLGGAGPADRIPASLAL